MVDQEIVHRTGLEGQRIGIVHLLVMPRDVGPDLIACKFLASASGRLYRKEVLARPRLGAGGPEVPDRAEIIYSEAI